MEKLVANNYNDNFTFYSKLLIIAIYFSGYVKKMGTIDLPLMAIFETNIGNETYFYIWQFLFLASSLFVFLCKKPKRFIFINGVLLIVALLMNQFNYAHNFFFCACLFIMFSFSNSSFNFVPFQISIVYFGSLLDKLVFEQWRNGDFMTAYLQNNTIVAYLSSYIETHSIIMLFTYATLIIEFLLMVLVLIPKARNTFIILGLCFHFCTTIVMDYFFSMFLIAIFISYFSILTTTIDFNKELNLSRFFNTLKSILTSYNKKKKLWFSFKLNKKTYTNYYAAFLYLILNPITIIIATILISYGPLRYKQLIYVTVLLLFMSFLVIDIFHQKRQLKN